MAAGPHPTLRSHARDIEWVFRTAGRAIAVVGLAILYVTVALTALVGWVSLNVTVLMVALSMVAAGCLWLVCMLAWPTASKGKVTIEGWVGILSVLPGVILGIVLPFIGIGAGAFWLVVTIVLFPGSIALFLLATRAKRAAERWRNAGQH